MSRIIPIVMSDQALSDAAREQQPAHDHAHPHLPDPSEPVPGPPPVYVRVDGDPISEADIAREMTHHPAADPHQSREDAARALVVRALLRREVERLELRVDAETEGGESPEEAAIRLLLEREAPAPEPDEAACRRYFEQNRERLHQPDRVRVRHILLAAAPSDLAARAAARDQGEALIAELREHPERFTEFALRHSACPSSSDGGELGWISHGQTTPEFERQLFMLKEGLAGLTLETRYGHHVVQVDAIERGAPLDFDAARPRIAAYLEAQARQNAIHQYLGILAQRYPVEGIEGFAAAA